MRFAIAAFLLASPAAADDSFNCPKPKGELSISPEISAHFPSHIDRWAPDPWVIDYRCRVDDEGRFRDCIFASRQEISASVTLRMEKMMQRAIRSVSTNHLNQPCVASTIKIETPPPASIPSPDKAAREREIPDRTDQNPA